MNILAGIVAGACLLLLAHTLVNLRLLRRPMFTAATQEPIAVLIPARNEAATIAQAVASVCAQRQVSHLSITVLDDESTDGTAEIASAAHGSDSRLHIFRSQQEPPQGWLGKSWACQQLSNLPHIQSASVLVFLDADVILEPDAVVSAVSVMRNVGLDVVCPYPRQRTITTLHQLVQPLLQWSWAATLPLRIAERSARPSLVAGNGQFLVVDAEAYRRCGGHASVAADVLEDIALVRSIKRAGGRGGVVDGTHIATCTMYRDNSSLIAGYSKSLWAAFGSRTNAALVGCVFALLFIVPAPAALWAWVSGSLTCASLWSAAYVAAVMSRLAVAVRTRSSRSAALAHPASIAVFLWLMARSWRAKSAGTLMWKGRVLP